jgi:flagellar biosynthetic protein FliP
VTLGSVMGILATLGFVLALLGVALKLLRRFAPTSTNGARLRMEVMQRLALGPKQGIAVIRVGERIVAVSVGDGGVHRLFEMEETELGVTQSATPAVLHGIAPVASRVDFKAAMRTALRTAGLASAVWLIGSASARPAIAQAPVVQTPVTQPPVAQPPVAQTPVVQAPVVQAPVTQRPVVQTPVARPTSPSRRADSLAKAIAGTTPGQSPVQFVQRISAAASRAPQAGPDIPKMDLKVGNGDGLHLSGTVGVVVMMGLLTLLPTLLLMMTGFTRILIVLNFLRQALGTQSAPPTQLVAGLALLLTGFVMAPTLSEVNRTALTPWMDGKIDQAQMLDLGSKPFRAFMLRQTRRQDIETFVRMSHSPEPATINDVPLVTLTSAFVISELRTSFQIGFALFLPFIIIDVAVSSVLMSMGMFMLPPAMISLPFKLLLFVLVDGWSLVVQSLVTSFR